MKKLILSTVILLAMGVLAFSYDVTSLSNMKGSARKVTKTNYSIVQKFGDYYRTPTTKVIYNFDNTGRSTGSMELNARDEVLNKVNVTYDEVGNLTAETCFDNDNNQLWSTTHTYKDGVKVETVEYSKGGGIKGKTTYTYSNSRLTSESYYDGEGSLVWLINSKYNEKGQLDSEANYFSDGKLDEKRVYSYTIIGNIDSISYFDEKDNLTSKEVFHYDDKGLLTEITRYGKDSTVTKRTIIRHDNHDNVTKVTGYDVLKKFGTTINEMSSMCEFSYEY